MRAGIGLVGVLLGVALMVYLFSESELEKVKQGEKVKEEARQISGYGQDAAPATESFAAAGQMKGSKLASLQVTSVTPGGAMDTFYGLKPGDEITEIDGKAIDLYGQDEELAKSLVVSEGYQKKKPLAVRRGGQRLILPLPAAAAAAAAAGGQSTPAPPTPDAPETPAPAPKERGIQGQLQDIQDAAGGRQDP